MSTSMRFSREGDGIDFVVGKDSTTEGESFAVAGGSATIETVEGSFDASVAGEIPAAGRVLFC